MKKKNRNIIIIVVAAVIVILLAGIAAYHIHSLNTSLDKAKADNQTFRQLAEMDKKEMENEYQQFALQYDEMKRTVKNDSLLKRLNQEQERANALLQELRHVKASDAQEIARLKRELATVREVLRTYIIQVDSLNRENQSLRQQNTAISQQYTAATQQVTSLTQEKQSLQKTVQIAAQLDATGVTLTPQNKKGKTAKKTKDIKRFMVTARIARNVTASTGEKRVYARILKPTNDVVSPSGSFTYENTTLACSASKVIEYNGEETPVQIVVNVSEMLTPGTYRLSLFCDHQMIGSTSINIKK